MNRPTDNELRQLLAEASEMCQRLVKPAPTTLEESRTTKAARDLSTRLLNAGQGIREDNEKRATRPEGHVGTMDDCPACHK